MNAYSSLKKRNNGSALAVVSLAMCVLLSATVLFSRLVTYAPPDTRHYIPLTESGGITTVTVGQRSADGSVSFERAGYSPDNHRLLTVSPGFRVYDENTVWAGRTDVEIFRISYENGTGQVTVNSSNGEKVLAPGTANEYSFALENTGNVPLEYTLTMEAYFSHGEYPIPVAARVVDYRGNYLAGSADAKVDVLELNNVSQRGTLKAGYVAPYTLEWEWPFEIDDEYDTMLGNLAVEEDITLTIVIKTMAVYNEDPENDADQGYDGGIPKTGDTSNVQLYFTVMVLSGAGLLLVLILPRRRRKREEEDG